jgi:hypothetical protein
MKLQFANNFLFFLFSVYLFSLFRSHRSSLLTNQARSATGNLLSHLTGIINSIPSQISLSNQQQQNEVPSNNNNNSNHNTSPVIIESTSSHVTIPLSNDHHNVHVLSSPTIEINSPSTQMNENDQMSKVKIDDKNNEDIKSTQHLDNGLITIVTINDLNSDNVNSIV